MWEDYSRNFEWLWFSTVSKLQIPTHSFTLSSSSHTMNLSLFICSFSFRTIVWKIDYRHKSLPLTSLCLLQKKSTWRCHVRRASTQVWLHLRREVWVPLGVFAVDHTWNHMIGHIHHFLTWDYHYHHHACVIFSQVNPFRSTLLVRDRKYFSTHNTRWPLFTFAIPTNPRRWPRLHSQISCPHRLEAPLNKWRHTWSS